MTRARNGAASAAPARARYVADPAEGYPGHAWLLDTVTGARNHLLPIAEIEKIASQRNGGRRTEAERAKLYERPEVIKVRVRSGYKARLRALAEESGYGLAEMIESWIEMEEQENAELARRTAGRMKE